MAQTTHISLHLVLFMISLVSKTNGLTLKMIPIDSPQLQILPKHVTVQERHQFLVNISMSRVNNYPIRLSPNRLKFPLAKLTKRYYYVTKIALGSGQGLLYPYLLIDTGSPETWVQCEGCDPCIETRAENFKYKMSPSFTQMSVDDPLCIPRLTYDGSCGIDLTYSSSQHAVGFVGRDNVHFWEAKTGKIVGFGGFAFGCALKNDGFEFDQDMRDNVIIGILGLALAPRSFLSQLDTETKERFSYCLAPNQGLSTMYFGDEAQISGDATREVQTIAMNKMIKYHIYVTGISVDGIRLPIDLSVFEFDPERYKNGFFVDSGTPYTSIPKSAYNTLEAAVARYFREKYGWEPTMPHRETYNLCYETYPSDVHGLPYVVFHFAGIRQQGEINWVMDNNFLFKKIYDGFCMTILSLQDPGGPSLFGAYQQINFKILFDVANGLLSFVPQNCQEASLSVGLMRDRLSLI